MEKESPNNVSTPVSGNDDVVVEMRGKVITGGNLTPWDNSCLEEETPNEYQSKPPLALSKN